MSSILPNTTQTPNLYLDMYMAFLTGEEVKVLWYTTRRTLGFHKETDHISLTQYQSGLTDHQGRVLDHGTGLCRSAVVTALEKLIEYGLITQGDPGSVTEAATWTLQLDETKVQHDKIMKRIFEKREVNRRRTAAATIMRSENREKKRLEKEGGGTWDVPGVVRGTDSQKKEENKTPENSLDTVVSSELPPAAGASAAEPPATPEDPLGLTPAQRSLFTALEAQQLITRDYNLADAQVLVDKGLAYLCGKTGLGLGQQSPEQAALKTQEQAAQARLQEALNEAAKGQADPLPPLPEVPAEYVARWSVEMFKVDYADTQYVAGMMRHYIPSGKKQALCGKRPTCENPGQSWQYGRPMPREQCPRCAAATIARAESPKPAKAPREHDPLFKHIGTDILNYAPENGTKYTRSQCQLINSIKGAIMRVMGLQKTEADYKRGVNAIAPYKAWYKRVYPDRSPALHATFETFFKEWWDAEGKPQAANNAPKCPTCQGDKKILERQADGSTLAVTCPTCHGEAVYA